MPATAAASVATRMVRKRRSQGSEARVFSGGGGPAGITGSSPWQRASVGGWGTPPASVGPRASPAPEQTRTRGLLLQHPPPRDDSAALLVSRRTVEVGLRLGPSVGGHRVAEGSAAQ